jgi:hypothetical protein
MHTTSRPLSRTTALLIATALTVLLATVSCGSSDKTADPPSTTLTSDTTVAADPADEAKWAYAEFWHVWTRANDPPNPDSPELALVATSGQLELLRNSIRDNGAKGLRFTEADPTKRTHSFTVLEFNEQRVVLEDCTVDDGISRDAASNEVIDDSVATYLFKATLVHDGNAWKLADNERLGKWPGITNCERS